ncbi:MAG: hypothetical protein MHMPM18_003387 [Marteilia pararefringens]
MNNIDIRGEIAAQNSEYEAKINEYIKCIKNQMLEEALKIAHQLVENEELLFIRGIIRLVVYPALMIIKIRRENLNQMLLSTTNTFFSSKTMILDQRNLIKTFVMGEIKFSIKLLEQLQKTKKTMTINNMDYMDDWKTNLAYLHL